jgi:hypothetical protein
MDRRSGSRRVRCRGAGGLDYTGAADRDFLAVGNLFVAITTVLPNLTSASPFYATLGRVRRLTFPRGKMKRLGWRPAIAAGSGSYGAALPSHLFRAILAT